MVRGDPRPAPTISSLATGSETSVATRTGSERATGRGQFPRWASRPMAQPSTESRPTPKFSRASPSTGHTDSSGIRSIHEGCQIRATHRIVESRRICRVEVVASCSREGPCTVGSTRAKCRLEKARQAVKAAQEAVAKFEQELQEGLQRLEDLRAAAAPFLANSHLASRHCCGGASVTSSRASFDSGTGRSPCEPFCRRPTNTGSVGFGLSREQECVKRESHTDRGSRHRPSEKSGTIRTMLTTNSQRRSRFGLRGVRVGEAAQPSPWRIRARTKVFSVPSSSDDAPLIQGRNSRIVGPSSPMIHGPVGLANCQKH